MRLAFLIMLAIVLAGCRPGEQVDERGWPKELVLGLVPSLEAEAMVDNLEPLADFLSEELGMPVTSFVPQDYTGLVEALGTGRADIGMLPPFAAMLGQRRYDIETVLISVREGETGYRSQFMTNDPSVCQTPVVEDERGYLTCHADVGPEDFGFRGPGGDAQDFAAAVGVDRDGASATFHVAERLGVPGRERPGGAATLTTRLFRRTFT